MSEIIAVDTENWSEFPEGEQARIDIVLQKLAERKENEAIAVTHIEPVAIPELMHQVGALYDRSKMTAIISNFGGCMCGECGGESYFALVVGSTKEIANGVIKDMAEEEGAVLLQDIMGEDGGIDMGRVIAEQIARSLGERFGGNIKIRQMTMEELTDLGIDVPEGAMVMGAEMPKKRTVH